MDRKEKRARSAPGPPRLRGREGAEGFSVAGSQSLWYKMRLLARSGMPEGAGAHSGQLSRWRRIGVVESEYATWTWIGKLGDRWTC
jgi:hypothetical protein